MAPTSPPPDLLGLSGAPHTTLQAVLTRFQESDLAGGRLILLTDRQGERSKARYAALIELGGRPVALSAPAFGPHYGPAGTSALLELVQWAQAQGLMFREAVVGGPQLNTLTDEPDAAEILQLIASSSPSDAGIYTTVKNVSAGL